ncbi:unnamed protein product [Zymoseptoria tritici ST99CH_3D7]|uniref:RanBP2-type domain-containing protein n=1 Tax=Zymoseptoria tritici (strain ST99CH_3D7) TaxID=1276538 RepID=A0A1X7RPM2_ZYMT9|nr:unnamed protein product [Zymoseptoria tritici ST99CH_3D7]
MCSNDINITEDAALYIHLASPASTTSCGTFTVEPAHLHNTTRNDTHHGAAESLHGASNRHPRSSWWTCCHCSQTNGPNGTTPPRCPVCGHFKDGSCTNY